jgi:hypothetical protein
MSTKPRVYLYRLAPWGWACECPPRLEGGMGIVYFGNSQREALAIAREWWEARKA